MPDVLIIGDSLRSPALRHEVPIGIGDPFLYAECGTGRHVVVSAFEIPRIAELGTDLQCHPNEEFGYDEFVARGSAWDQVWRETWLRAAHGLGIRTAVVPSSFPLYVADRLRAIGIELRPDPEFFADRRRVKSELELAGIRRAQRAAEAGMSAARELLRRAEPNRTAVLLDGEPLTCERLKAAVEEAFLEYGATAEELIVSHGPQTAIGHDMGSGAIAPGEPIVLDLFPRDRESGCYADMTRTFVVGTPSDELVEYQRLCREALDRALNEIRPGAGGKELHRQTCELFHQHGYPTQLSKASGEVLSDGFYHSLGHGVGLELHEDPTLGRVATDLVAGDVVAIEPGLYRYGYGGCRLEDIVLVTEDGAENLTNFPYDLAPS